MSGQIKHYVGDKDVQLILGTLLRVGVILSSCIVLIGGIIFLTNHPLQHVSFEHFNHEAKFSSVAAIIEGLKTFDGLAIIQFGVLLLIFTPIARVV